MSDEKTKAARHLEIALEILGQVCDNAHDMGDEEAREAYGYTSDEIVEVSETLTALARPYEPETDQIQRAELLEAVKNGHSDADSLSVFTKRGTDRLRAVLRDLDAAEARITGDG